MKRRLWKETIKIWIFGILKIPMVAWLRPDVMELDDGHSMIKMPLRRRTKNHVGSMYFGAMVVGAELTPGIVAIRLFHQRNLKPSFLFSQFSAKFLKRADDDVYFIFEEGQKIADAIDQAIKTKERQSVDLTMKGICREEVIANFTITISLKV